MKVAAAADATASPSADTNFVESLCSAVRYPTLCVRSLTAHASAIEQSPLQLAQSPLAESLSGARSTRLLLVRSNKFKGPKVTDYRAIRECFQYMDDAVNLLTKSVKEIQSAAESKGKYYRWHVSNAKTWVDSAEQDSYTCCDGYMVGLQNGRLKTSTQSHVADAGQLTSNSLTLITNLSR
ncbi:pectinesterase inhibitor 11-like [Rhodamnia argentea]|uniref:Pectinesterase inhibitor 11-like n=1 Tax=Rhodamnia argentea TaxID=178133 RepID=A0A8B8Q1C8_9MYRT|nr:pectinesterase inhibitor 11-like [Rhodamnia argentea]